MATSIMIDAGHGGTDPGAVYKEEEKRMTIFPCHGRGENSEGRWNQCII